MVSKIGGAGLAQSLLARVESRKAQETAAVATTTASSEEPGTPAASTRSAQTEATERVGAQLNARVGGGAASSSGSAATDYIAEADTNNDRKVSEQERIAYAKKQASEAEKAASKPDAPARQSRAQEVQQAYLPQEAARVQLDIEA